MNEFKAILHVFFVVIINNDTILIYFPSFRLSINGIRQQHQNGKWQLILHLNSIVGWWVYWHSIIVINYCCNGCGTARKTNRRNKKKRKATKTCEINKNKRIELA